MKAYGVWNLGLERVDFGILLGSARDCANAIFGGIEPKTSRKKSDVCATDRGTETLYWWQNLFVKVVVNIWLQLAVRFQDFINWIGVFSRILSGP